MTQSTSKAIAKTEKTMGRASIIEAYIQQLLAWNQPITPSILKAIADEIGVTQGELDAINQTVQAHMSRGHHYVETGDLNNGINELTLAKGLDPINLELLLSLAYAYNLRYNQDSDLADREQALLTAQRCLELYPNNPEARALVNAWQQTAATLQVSRQTKPNIFILISFLENIFSPKRLSRRTKTKIAVLILFLQQPISFSAIVRWTMPPLAILTGGVATIGLSFVGWEHLPVFSKPESEAIIQVPVFDPGPNVPISFNYPGLLIEPRISRLGDYDGNAYYKLHGIVLNDSGQEVRKLDLKVELLDGYGATISTIDQVAVTGSGRVIRPDASQSFNLFHKITPDLMSVRVSVIDIEQFEQFSQSDKSFD